MKIFLNPGHGIKNSNTIDTGAIGSSGLKEYIETAEICNIIANKFATKTSGIEVKVYQDGDLEDISNTANVWMSDYFFSIHCNASTDSSAHGIETYAFSPNSRGNKLAKSIQNELIIVTGLTDRGVKFANYHVLRETIMPAVLVEIGFISNPNEESLMNNSSWDEKVAEAIFKGICNELEIKIVDNQSSVMSEPSTPIIISEIKKHLIMGKAEITTEQAEQYLHKINPDAPYYAEIYKEEAEKEGVRWDYAFSQTIKETNHFRFGGIALPEWNNFSGIGVTGAKYIPEQAKEEQFVDGVIVIKDINNKSVGVKFSTLRLGIRCQIQHLKAYSSSESLVGKCIDPRFHLVTRGIAPCIEDLNGKWAVPGTTYGQDIVEICNRIAKEVVEVKEKYEVPTGNNIFAFPTGIGWIETLPDRVIIHYDKYNYLSVQSNGIYAYSKDGYVKIV